MRLVFHACLAILPGFSALSRAQRSSQLKLHLKVSRQTPKPMGTLSGPCGAATVRSGERETGYRYTSGFTFAQMSKKYLENILMLRITCTLCHDKRNMYSILMRALTVQVWSWPLPGLRSASITHHNLSHHIVRREIGLRALREEHFSVPQLYVLHVRTDPSASCSDSPSCTQWRSKLRNYHNHARP